MQKLKEVFGTTRPLIGALHFPPLPGFDGYTNMEKILNFSLKNAQVMEEAGFDSIIVENNYDLPHKITVGRETIDAMKFLTESIIRSVNIPVGISVLWNSYEAGFDIATSCGGKYIRVPVFVDNVETSYGKIFGEPEKVIEAREKFSAESVLILTDIQVKHSKLLNVRPIRESAMEAIEKGSDALIVTGKWTGDSPKIEELKEVREATGLETPIIIGSGATIENVASLMKYANGIIVGTAIKDTEELSREIHTNLVEAYVPVSKEKALKFVKSYQKTL